MQKISCGGRTVDVFLPEKSTQAPVVIYGHGQALGLEQYRATFEHLARKGVATIFPTYDTGFFDQNWERMGRDYVKLSDCALSKFAAELDRSQVVYSGHSKGAYVATLAAGIAGRDNLSPEPRALLVFAPAGAWPQWLAEIPVTTAVTVVHSDRDSIVSRDLSLTIYQSVKSERKQLIDFKSFIGVSSSDLLADHFWVLTKKSLFGGGPPSAFHYYGSWKWLVASALDPSRPIPFSDPYLYGERASDKGLLGLHDNFVRNWE